MIRRIALAGTMVLASIPLAYADTPAVIVADQSAYVSAGPIYQIFISYLLPILGIVLPVLLTWGLTQLQTRTGIRMSDSDRAALQQAVLNAGGRIIASLEPAAMNMRIDVGNAKVASEADKVVKALPDIAKRLGVSPEDVQHMVAGAVGRLQASGSAVVPAIPPVASGPLVISGSH